MLGEAQCALSVLQFGADHVHDLALRVCKNVVGTLGTFGELSLFFVAQSGDGAAVFVLNDLEGLFHGGIDVVSKGLVIDLEALVKKSSIFFGKRLVPVFRGIEEPYNRNIVAQEYVLGYVAKTPVVDSGIFRVRGKDDALLKTGEDFARRNGRGVEAEALDGGHVGLAVGGAHLLTVDVLRLFQRNGGNNGARSYQVEGYGMNSLFAEIRHDVLSYWAFRNFSYLLFAGHKEGHVHNGEFGSKLA